MTSEPTTRFPVFGTAVAVTPVPVRRLGVPEPCRHGLPVRRQVFRGGQRDHPAGGLAQRVLGVLDEVDAAQEGLHREPGGVPRAAAGGQHVVRPGAVVAERHRRPRPDEDRPGVADPQRDLAGVRGLDLQVLGGVGVDDREPVGDVADQDRAGLRAGERGADALGCLVAATCCSSSASTASASASRGDQHRRRRRVVLGLGDQVRRDVHRIGRVVGEHGDLGGPGLGVDPDQAAQQPLGRGEVGVARAGDHVDGLSSCPSVSVPPYASSATACAPPTAHTSSTPSSAAAARIVGAAARRARPAAGRRRPATRRRPPAPARRS